MLISEISFRILYIFKRLHVLQMLFFNLVEHNVRLFTNKQEFWTVLHLRSFRQFQNLSEETWSCAAENLIELCFVAILSNKSKKSTRPITLVCIVLKLFPFKQQLHILNAIRNASSTFHVFYTLMYLTYFLSLYPFAVPKPDFLYKTASLQ